MSDPRSPTDDLGLSGRVTQFTSGDARDDGIDNVSPHGTLMLSKR